MLAAVLAIVTLHLVPKPVSLRALPCPRSGAPFPLLVPPGMDPGSLDELNERWRALGIGAAHPSSTPNLRFVHDSAVPPQGYVLTVDASGATISSSDADGAFYGVMTLAQLPVRQRGRRLLPCVRIVDHPAMRWRILSDDVSRGPLPRMRYFKERIRTIAAFKMNGYSPYMENAFLSPIDPLPAPLDGITPAQLAELARYAARFHVALIPEQQTFAHMHGTLRIESYASAAAFPHGFLLSPASPVTLPYLTRIITQELAAVPHPPFFHIGSDETTMLGEGATAAYVAAHGGRSAVYAEHVNAMAKIIAPSGARVMLWDDGVEADPSIMAHIPKNAVVVNWHYAVLPSYEKYIQTIERGGLEQMVAPGASNWNEIFPNVDAAIANERRFIDEGKRAHVLGLFEAVWNDDGETLYEATWYPVLYAAACAWESRDVDPARFRADFPEAFFGSNDPGYGDDVAKLAAIETALGGNTDKLFWGDPFDPVLAARMAKIDLRAVRLNAEAVETHLYSAHPPLHANAARVMLLAARRFDALGRRYQIGEEVRQYYADASLHPADAIRDLFWCKYWFWEQRDSDERLAPLYADAWRYESRPGHLASNLERYHLDAQLAIERADAIDRVTYETYIPTKKLPALEDVLRQPQDDTVR
jgi:hexosaminidase